MKTIQELFNLEGKVAVITGAAMGIGYGIAQRFHEAGAHVIIADIDEEVGSQKAEALTTSETRCVFVKTDVSDEQEVKNLDS